MRVESVARPGPTRKAQRCGRRWSGDNPRCAAPLEAGGHRSKDSSMKCSVIVSNLILMGIVLGVVGARLPAANGQEFGLSDIPVKLLLPHPKGNTGATVPAEIQLQGASEVGAFQMALIYDEKL